MHRLDERQRALVLTLLRVMERAWKHSPYPLDIEYQYQITPPAIISDLITWQNWSVVLTDIIPVLEVTHDTLLSETPVERERDMQIIYERLNLTPPTD